MGSGLTFALEKNLSTTDFATLFEARGVRSVFCRPDYFDAFAPLLTPDFNLLVARDCGQAVASLPVLEVSEATYQFFRPARLIEELAKRWGAHELASQLKRVNESSAVVCAVPFAYRSPFTLVPEPYLSACMDSVEDHARQRGISSIAYLYFNTKDSVAVELLRKRGYLLLPLEANAILQVDPSWRSLSDYLAALANPRKWRREVRAFIRHGMNVDWCNPPSQTDIDCAAELDFEFLSSKGHSFSLHDRQEAYARYATIWGEDCLIAFARLANGVPVASLLTLLDHQTLIPKSIGFHQSFSQQQRLATYAYFNLGYYSCVEYAIARGYTKIDLGPSSAQTKRLRGAVPSVLWGAFRSDGDNRINTLHQSLENVFRTGLEKAWGGAPLEVLDVTITNDVEQQNSIH